MIIVIGLLFLLVGLFLIYIFSDECYDRFEKKIIDKKSRIEYNKYIS